MPPYRDCNHSIQLKPNTKPMNLKLYRYNHFQKNEIEKQVKEMLSHEIIQPSHSPFTSLVLLVKKEDNSWRFYIDYRQLNDATVKNKFSIPIIDDLLDELQGATIFSKLS